MTDIRKNRGPHQGEGICNHENPNLDTIHCQMKVDSAHVSHWFKTPWEEFSWPNNQFVRPESSAIKYKLDAKSLAAKVKKTVGE